MLNRIEENISYKHSEKTLCSMLVKKRIKHEQNASCRRLKLETLLILGLLCAHDFHKWMQIFEEEIFNLFGLFKSWEAQETSENLMWSIEKLRRIFVGLNKKVQWNSFRFVSSSFQISEVWWRKWKKKLHWKEFQFRIEFPIFSRLLSNSSYAFFIEFQSRCAIFSDFIRYFLLRTLFDWKMSVARESTRF